LPFFNLNADFLHRFSFRDHLRMNLCKANWTINHSTLFVCFWRDSPQLASASSFIRILDHTTTEHNR